MFALGDKDKTLSLYPVSSEKGIRSFAERISTLGTFKLRNENNKSMKKFEPSSDEEEEVEPSPPRKHKTESARKGKVRKALGSDSENSIQRKPSIVKRKVVDSDSDNSNQMKPLATKRSASPAQRPITAHQKPTSPAQPQIMSPSQRLTTPIRKTLNVRKISRPTSPAQPDLSRSNVRMANNPTSRPNGNQVAEQSITVL